MTGPLAALLLVAQAQIIVPIDHPGAVPDLAARVEQACGTATPADGDALRKAELRAADAVGGRNVSATAWSDLACARARLAQTDLIAHDGPLMITGSSWAEGSINAALKALTVDGRDKRAAQVLALIALDEAEPKPLAAIVKSLLDAVHAGLHDPAVWRGCAELALRAGDTESSRDCANSALHYGVDSTWHLLRLARISFREADSVTGSQSFQAAAAAARDSMTRLEIEWHLQWFLSPEERAQWDSLPDASRGTWVRDRLAARDVRDGQAPGSRLAEHFSRLEYVEAHFRLTVPKNRRDAASKGPAYIMLPQGTACDTATYTQRSGGTGACDPLAKATDPNDPNGAFEPGDVPARPFRDYVRWQVDYDDRGVVWMRFGPPTKRVPWVGKLTVREAWLYEIDGRKMVLNFEGEEHDGSAEATRLVTGVLGSYLCDIDVARCGLNTRAQNGQLRTEQLDRVRQQDREAVVIATTKDDNSVRAAKHLDMVAQLHRLWDPKSGAPIAVVSYALRLTDLSVQESYLSRTALVDLALRQYDPAAGRWSDSAQFRHLNLPDKSSKDTHVTGYFVVPSSPDVTEWSLTATQPDDRTGRAFEEEKPPLAVGSLTMSDLVLGERGQGISWKSSSGEVPLAPLGAINRKRAVQLYFQVLSDMARATVKTTVVLYKVEAGPKNNSPVLQLGFTGSIHGGMNETMRELDVSHLDGGTYRLEVQLTDGNLTVKRSSALYLK